jgi:hypothetical protein
LREFFISFKRVFLDHFIITKQYSCINNPHHCLFQSKLPTATLSNCVMQASITPVSAAQVQQTINPTTSTTNKFFLLQISIFLMNRSIN